MGHKNHMKNRQYNQVKNNNDNYSYTDNEITQILQLIVNISKRLRRSNKADITNWSNRLAVFRGH